MNTPHTLTHSDVEFDAGSGTIIRYLAAHTQIIIPATLAGITVTGIAERAFAECGLTALTLPAGLKTINNFAFYANSLSDIEIPESVWMIGYYAFFANSLTRVRLLRTRISVNYHAFDYHVVKVSEHPPKGSLDCDNPHLNIFTPPGGGIENEINVSNLTDASNLHLIADTFIALAANIDVNCRAHQTEPEYDMLAYGIRVISAEGIEGENIVSRFVGDLTLEAKVVQFIQHVNDWCRAHDAHLWLNDEAPLGEQAAYLLALHDVQYVPLYCEVLLQNDMDHEVYQAEHIDALVAKHGLDENIIQLMAYRVGAAYGQHGDHIEQYQTQLFDYFARNPALKTQFLHTAAQSVYQAHAGYVLSFYSICLIANYIKNKAERASWIEWQKTLAQAEFGDAIDFDYCDI